MHEGGLVSVPVRLTGKAAALTVTRDGLPVLPEAIAVEGGTLAQRGDTPVVRGEGARVTLHLAEPDVAGAALLVEATPVAGILPAIATLAAALRLPGSRGASKP